MITVHITEDQKLMVELLSEVINTSQIAVVSSLSYNITDCRTALATCTPDVLLLDLGLPDGNGIDFCAEVCKQYPQIKVIALTVHNEYSTVQRMLKNGAKGFISKDSAKQEIIAGIEKVMQNEIFYSDDVLNQKSNDIFFLTKREKEIVQLILKGYSAQEIAKKSFTATVTVQKHFATIKRKLGAKTLADVARIAIEKFLV